MISAIYKKAFAVLMKKPVRLWGISLLSMVLTLLANVGFAGILAIGFVVNQVLGASMAMIYLKGYRGEEVESTQLFTGFRKENFTRTAGGMAWKWLWVFLWGLIPFCGFVFAYIKRYTYAFTPYILLSRPEVEATKAMKVSEKETYGYRGKMFLADFLMYLIFGAAVLVVGLLALIPFVGILFRLIEIVLILAGVALLPLFQGLVSAAFYEEIQKCNADPEYRRQFFEPAPRPQPAPQAAQPGQAPQAPSAAPQAAGKFCPNCGTSVPAGSGFCPNCGTKLS